MQLDVQKREKKMIIQLRDNSRIWTVQSGNTCNHISTILKKEKKSFISQIIREVGCTKEGKNWVVA